MSDALDLDWRSMMSMAYIVASGSQDPSTQNSALLLGPGALGPLAAACNGLPRGVPNVAEHWQRPLKYKVVEHAERNVIYCAAKAGIATEGLTMVAPWAACTDCARAIIQAGIVQLVRHQDSSDRSPDRWSGDIDIADGMLVEAGVEIISIKGRVCPDGFVVRHSEQEWTP